MSDTPPRGPRPSRGNVDVLERRVVEVAQATPDERPHAMRAAVREMAREQAAEDGLMPIAQLRVSTMVPTPIPSETGRTNPSGVNLP